jgi:hypothetical protein
VVALKIIHGKDYPRKDDGHCDYDALLRKCNLSSLSDKREKRMLSFGKKCISHPTFVVFSLSMLKTCMMFETMKFFKLTTPEPWHLRIQQSQQYSDD